MHLTNKLSSAFALSISLVALASCGGGGGDGPSGDDAIDNFTFSVDSDFASGYTEDFVSFIEEDIGGSVEPINRIQNFFNNQTVPVNYTSCDEANAYYSLADRSITLCHEFTNLSYSYYLQLEDETLDQTTRENNAALKAFAVLNFVMYHEMGHALDDLTNLQVGGNFESVADAIGVVLSIQTNQPEASIYGGLFFLIDTEASFNDEHIGGADRAGDVLCWTIGSSSQIAAAFPEATASFNEGGRDCVGEYANQYQFVAGLIPFLSEIPPKTSLKLSESAFLAQFAGMDEYMVELLNARK